MAAGQNVQDSSTVNFNGDCGEATSSPNSATCDNGGIGLAPTQSITVNNGPVQNCVVGNDSATVFSIELLSIAGPYDYQISVLAQGPDSIWGGSFYLAFTDASNDTYYLSIYSSSKETHTVDYNSSNPNIVKIWWCDESFSVDSDSEAKSVGRTKPDFRVTSPANKG